MESATNFPDSQAMPVVVLESLVRVAARQPRPRLSKLQALMAGERKEILAIILIGVAALIPMMVWGIPSGGDLPNHFRFAQPFYDSIRNGHIYPGWLSESNYGFGDARFRFYPPGLYYLLAVFKAATSWYWASLLSFALLSVLGGLGAYFWRADRTR